MRAADLEKAGGVTDEYGWPVIKGESKPMPEGGQ